MLSSGNGKVQNCARNLLMLVAGEVPYDRLKGINPDVDDSPSSIAENEFMQSAEELLEIYEPRIDIYKIDMNGLNPYEGDYAAVVKEV